MQQNKKDKKISKAKRVNSYLKYSGMVYQLFGLLAVSIFLGLKADKYFQFENKYITASATLLVFFAFMYKISISITNDDS